MAGRCIECGRTHHGSSKVCIRCLPQVCTICNTIFYANRARSICTKCKEELHNIHLHALHNKKQRSPSNSVEHILEKYKSIEDYDREIDKWILGI